MLNEMKILDSRRKQVLEKGSDTYELDCEKASAAGAVSQRACVFCGSRVVLYPITDALHLIHGPIGCAAYTWDIRGAMSSDRELHRFSFSTDLNETDIIYGGEKKLYKILKELIKKHHPKAAFIYSTCIVGIIGDDVTAVCKKVEQEVGIPVIPVHSEGFKGTKKDGYTAACEAIFKIIRLNQEKTDTIPHSINILGEFNLAGEAWIIKDYYKKMGINVVSTITGDGKIEEIMNSRRAALNVVQCSGSMTKLAQMMEKEYQIPFIRVSYFGLEDMSSALYDVAKFFGNDSQMLHQAKEIVSAEISSIYPTIEKYGTKLQGKKAAIYVGGAFKAFSLIKALKHLKIDVVLAGSQTGNKEDYKVLREMCDDGTVIVDDSNPIELSKFILEKDVDLFIGGVKERPMAYKLGVGFCDHNHERKIPLAGFIGMENFAKEVYQSVMSPVWQFVPRVSSKSKGRGKNEK